ncbi:MFS transporter [Glycomyces sp. MUSA5-2]|uniref:MFS transporter n=1 Tax=Glycomyces sp. MUSA5-2 TaxID=2053002 RepID=UPI0030093AE8
MSDALRLLRDRALRRYWYGRVLSLAAASAALVATPVLLYQQTGSPLWVSALVAVQGLPYLVLGPVAGAVADRCDRAALLRAAELATALALAAIPAAALFGPVPPLLVVAAVAVARTAFVFADAANFGLVPALAPPGRLAETTALLFATSTVVEMVGPSLVGAALALLPVPYAIAAGAAASALALACYAAAGLPGAERAERPSSGLYRDIADAAHWLLAHRPVRSTIALGVAVAVSQGVFVSQAVPWAAERLGAGGDGSVAGLLFTAWAVGGLAATAAVPALARRTGQRPVAFGAMWIAAAGAVGCAFAVGVPAAVAASAVWGLGYLAVVLAAVVWRQLSTPDRLRSRVNTAARMAAYGVGYPLGGVLGGWAATAAGPHVAMGGAGAVVAGVAVVSLSGLRR